MMLNYTVSHSMNFTVDGHVFHRCCGFITVMLLAIRILNALKWRRDLIDAVNIPW